MLNKNLDEKKTFELQMALLCSSQEVLNDLDLSLLATIADAKLLTDPNETETSESQKKLLFQKYRYL